MKSIATTIIITCLLSATNTAAQEVPVTLAKSPHTASAVSLIGTTAPVFFGIAAGDDAGAYTVILGSIVGPGLGHAYAANPGRFFLGAGIRTLGWGACAVGFATSWDNPDNTGSAILAVGGLAIITVSTVVDIVTADNSARKFNRSHPGPQLSVMPAYSPSTETYGLRITVNL